MPNQYAGFGIRLWASTIDSVLLLLIMVPVLYTIYGSAYLDEYIAPFKLLFDSSGELLPSSVWGVGNSLLSREQGFWELLLSYGLPAVAVIVFWMYRSATPGKMLNHLVIVDMSTGGKPTHSQLVIRYLAYYVSLLPLGLGFLWIVWDTSKQGWHDKMARTYVIKTQDY